MKAKRYEDLIVWQKSFALVKNIYSLTEKFPNEEKYSMTNQVRRSCVSIPANIAEGFGRYHPKEKIRFYNISIASLNETENYLKLAQDLKISDTNALQKECVEIRKMLCSYIKAIRSNTN
jgi:four helix bundle protein